MKDQTPAMLEIFIINFAVYGSFFPVLRATGAVKWFCIRGLEYLLLRLVVLPVLMGNFFCTVLAWLLGYNPPVIVLGLIVNTFVFHRWVLPSLFPED